MKLDADDIEAVAARVVELLAAQQPSSGGLLDAAALARALNVDRSWVYAHASELGAVRLGDGPRARLRFDIERTSEALARLDAPEEPPPVVPPRRRRRPKAAPAPEGLALIPGRRAP